MRRGSDTGIDRLARLGDEIVSAAWSAELSDMPSVGVSGLALVAASGGGVRPGELVERTGLSSGGVTLLLDRLEQAGLVERTSGRPPDRRAVVVTTTPLGARTVEAGLAVFAAMTDSLVDAIT